MVAPFFGKRSGGCQVGLGCRWWRRVSGKCRCRILDALKLWVQDGSGLVAGTDFNREVKRESRMFNRNVKKKKNLEKREK